MKINLRKLWHGLSGRDNHRRNVALVLSGGGARGLAHIGAIEALEARGYHITSVAGTSIGALVGGVYAAGRLSELKVAVTGLNRKRILKLMDISPGLDHIATGRHLMEMLDTMIGGQTIETLPTPFCCVASDVVSGHEHVFGRGSLKRAIRASISIPGVFKPVYDGSHLYVDGSVHNALPLDRVHRTKGDLLVAMNVSAPDEEPFTDYLKKYGEPENETDKSIWRRIPFLKTEFSANYMNMMLRVAKLAIQNNTQMAMRLTPPDIFAEMPMGEYSLFDFDKADEIIVWGKERMDEALEQWERAQNP
ncbi:MAG: patatin-like phospholipase family protein [Prevotella sp.]|nr:patatin-like phospholipase family protein [Prevotella sp.]